MTGQSVLEAAIDGAGRRLRRRRASCTSSSTRSPIPSAPTRSDVLVERFGEAQARFEELGGYGLEARAREVLAGLGFAPEQVDGDVGTLSGGWKMRVGARADPAHAARRAAARRAHQPPRPRVDPVARGVAARLRGRARDDLARPRVPEPDGRQDHRDRRRRADHLLRATTTSTSASARYPNSAAGGAIRSASRRCSPRRRHSSRASRRARATPRRCSRA